MGYRVLRLHTAHDDLEFKTLERKVVFNEVITQLERLRNQPTDGSAASTASGELRTWRRVHWLLTNGRSDN